MPETVTPTSTMAAQFRELMFGLIDRRADIERSLGERARYDQFCDGLEDLKRRTSEGDASSTTAARVAGLRSLIVEFGLQSLLSESTGSTSPTGAVRTRGRTPPSKRLRTLGSSGEHHDVNLLFDELVMTYAR